MKPGRLFIIPAAVAAAALTVGVVYRPAPPPISFPAVCHTVGTPARPDPRCTPGRRNPNVTQTNIGTTICTPGWTATIRPSTSYTNRVKVLALSAYGIPAGTIAELDHFIPLELGGAPTDVRNLWPQIGPIPNAKDAVENRLRRAVCAGTVTLAAAQAEIIANWSAAP